MRNPRVPRVIAGGEQALFFISLKSTVSGAALRRAAHERARIQRKVDVAVPPGGFDRVGKHVEFAIDGRTRHDLEPLIAVGR